MGETFTASRLTRGNRLFPTVLEVTPTAVRLRKRVGLGLSVREESVAISKIASVSILSGILGADLRIESSGGTAAMESHGHTRGDARRIKEMIEGYQARGEA